MSQRILCPWSPEIYTSIIAIVSPRLLQFLIAEGSKWLNITDTLITIWKETKLEIWVTTISTKECIYRVRFLIRRQPVLKVNRNRWSRRGADHVEC